MYIAINRFKINRGQEDAFENMWQRRETHLDNVPGFIKFHLAKGNFIKPIPYISHTAPGTQKKILPYGQNQKHSA